MSAFKLCVASGRAFDRATREPAGSLPELAHTVEAVKLYGLYSAAVEREGTAPDHRFGETVTLAGNLRAVSIARAAATRGRARRSSGEAHARY